MARSWADQVVAVERIEKPLDHRPDGDRQHVDEGGRGERRQKELALAGVRPTSSKSRVIVRRGASVAIRENGHDNVRARRHALISAPTAFRPLGPTAGTPSPSGRRWAEGADG